MGQRDEDARERDARCGFEEIGTEECSTTRRVESRAWTCARSACSLIFTVIVATVRMFWLFVVVSLSLFMMTGAASMQRSALVSSRDLEREISDRWTMYTHEILASMN